MEVKRGEIYIADLTASEGSEQNGVRPVLVIQNDKGNAYAPTVIIAPISRESAWDAANKLNEQYERDGIYIYGK